MRIIGGQFRGKQIMPPRRLPVRPTTDRARESLFNILANALDFSDIRVLDLFSGTGMISLEFASRGCRDITSVDIHPGCVNFLRETCQGMALEGIRVIKADVFRRITKLPPGYDVIFADPPYDHPRLNELPDLVFGTGLLNEKGCFVLEHSSRHSFTSCVHFREQRKYGDVLFTFMV